MKHLIPTAMLGAAVLAGCTSAPLTPPGSFAGDWSPVSAQLGGAEFPLASFGGSLLHLTADTYEFAGDHGDFTFSPGTSPAQMDIHGRQGPNAGKTILTIYEIKDDDMTVCYQLGAGPRPTDFTSPKGTQIFLVHYHRVH